MSRLRRPAALRDRRAGLLGEEDEQEHHRPYKDVDLSRLRHQPRLRPIKTIGRAALPIFARVPVIRRAVTVAGLGRLHPGVSRRAAEMMGARGARRACPVVAVGFACHRLCFLSRLIASNRAATAAPWADFIGLRASALPVQRRHSPLSQEGLILQPSCLQGERHPPWDAHQILGLEALLWHPVRLGHRADARHLAIEKG